MRPDEELLRLFVARVVVEATDHFVWALNFSGRDITDALDVARSFLHFQKTNTLKVLKLSVTIVSKVKEFFGFESEGHHETD